MPPTRRLAAAALCVPLLALTPAPAEAAGTEVPTIRICNSARSGDLDLPVRGSDGFRRVLKSGACGTLKNDGNRAEASIQGLSWRWTTQGDPYNYSASACHGGIGDDPPPYGWVNPPNWKPAVVIWQFYPPFCGN